MIRRQWMRQAGMWIGTLTFLMIVFKWQCPGKITDNQSHKSIFVSSRTATKSKTVISTQSPAKRRFSSYSRRIGDYDAETRRRISELSARRAAADDDDVVRLARDVIDFPEHNVDGIKHARYIMKTPQAAKVDQITQHKRGGFFVECGALDGERSSNTLYLEKERGWTGLLVEMDPYFYTQLIGKNRRVWSVNACLSPYSYITELSYRGDESGAGKLLMNTPKTVVDTRRSRVPCFPLYSLLLAINRTHIDYFSLDVEGFELPILETIPWDRLDIRTLSVEYGHGANGKEPYTKFMTSVGYSIYADIHESNFEKALFVEDFIFIRNVTTY